MLPDNEEHFQMQKHGKNISDCLLMKKVSQMINSNFADTVCKIEILKEY